MEQDKAKLKATEFEILLLSQVKKLKDWANKEIEKL